MDIRKANRWKFPKISYTNFAKEFPNLGKDVFREWFQFSRCWGGRVWEISIKRHGITLDFRMCPWSDMAFPEAEREDREEIEKLMNYEKE